MMKCVKDQHYHQHHHQQKEINGGQNHQHQNQHGKLQVVQLIVAMEVINGIIMMNSSQVYVDNTDINHTEATADDAGSMFIY